jgi:hypothetical protein
MGVGSRRLASTAGAERYFVAVHAVGHAFAPTTGDLRPPAGVG